ncbi:MAG TPA: mechanosensitive ion channel domain-containing protein [Xenococcaceae cyanobacterium]
MEILQVRIFNGIAIYRKIKVFLLILVILSNFVGVTAGKATDITNQSPSNQATVAAVVLDGRQLFQVNSSNNLDAIARADKINRLLKTKLHQHLTTQGPFNVEVAKQQQWTIIRVNQRHLVTVTENDTIPGMMPEEQAEVWQETIEVALQKALEERSPAYIAGATKTILINLALVFVIQCGLFWLSRRYRRKSLEQARQKMGSWQILGIFLLQTSIWLSLIYYSANLFPFTRTWLYQLGMLLNMTFNSEVLNLGEKAISLSHLLFLIFIGIGLWLFVSWLAQILKWRILPLTGFDETWQSSIVFMTRYGLLLIGLLLIFNSSGIDLRSLTILLSALGVGIGFGLQNIVKDFISGVILNLTRPIKVGELVEVEDLKGLVLRIGARTTEISHIDRYIITVPNSRLIEQAVKNWNRSGLTRVKVYVNVSYDSNRELVYKALLAAAQTHHPDILKHPPPKAQFRGFGDHGLSFRVVVFIKDPLKEPKARNHLQYHIDQNLRKYEIEIPFHQRDLHLKIPQLNELIADLAKQHAPVKNRLYYPQEINSHNAEEPSFSPEEPTIYDEYDWQALTTAMRGDKGVEIKDRRYNFKTYRKTFLGSDAVNWLIQYEKATRVEAIAIGQLMIEQGLIHHVLDEHNFKDEPLFYRFYLDEAEDKQ